MASEEVVHYPRVQIITPTEIPTDRAKVTLDGIEIPSTYWAVESGVGIAQKVTLTFYASIEVKVDPTWNPIELKDPLADA